MIHPDLVGIARWLPRGVVPGRAALWVAQAMSAVAGPLQRYRPPDGVTVTEHRVGELAVRVFSPTGGASPRPALLWIHGGGYVLPGSVVDDVVCGRFVQRLGVTVVSLDYRLAPQHPYPAALGDCMAAYRFVHASSAELGVDPARVVIGGASAGGGLAAALALRIVDEGAPAPALQLLVYPMIDDQNVGPREGTFRVWDPASNRVGWSSYLRGVDPVPDHAAPARRVDLRGLPPAWIGVGALDLFHDEDLDYARRLREAGVPVETVVVEGAFHGFDMVVPSAPVSQRFFEAQVAAIAAAVG
jgi:acetyl esterase/lipase